MKQQSDYQNYFPIFQCNSSYPIIAYIRKAFSFLFIFSFLFSSCIDHSSPTGPSGNDNEPVCNPDEPVVLNETTIPESRVTRNSNGCVITLNLNGLGLFDSQCLLGLDNFSETLETLLVSDNNLDSIDLSPVSICTNLRTLNLSYNRFTEIDIYYLSYCSRLEKLYINENLFDQISLSDLSFCTNLKTLSLWDNYLTSIDLSPLSSCLFFEFLDIGENKLTTIDLAPFEGSSDLKKIYLDCNELIDISLAPIWEINMDALYLDCNNLGSTSCNQVCDFSDSHPYCDIRTDCACLRN